jgi:hypothetical protein
LYYSINLQQNHFPTCWKVLNLRREEYGSRRKEKKETKKIIQIPREITNRRNN